MNLQPSELMKIAIVLALARFYAQLPPGNTRTFTALWPALVMIGIPAALVMLQPDLGTALAICAGGAVVRSEEHTSELQSLMRISYAVFCLKKKKQYNPHRQHQP